MNEVSLLVAYHKKADILNVSPDFIPIQVGKALYNGPDAEWFNDNMIGDNTGDNISIKNPLYNELTAVYYAWKNIDSKYYGLMHYRRYFVFSGLKKTYYSRKRIDDKFVKMIGYDEEQLRSNLEKYDFIAPIKMYRSSVYEHYKNAHMIEDLDLCMDVIKAKFPDYVDSMFQYIYGHDAYFYNMFIFNKETFNKYCDFMFTILSECEGKIKDTRFFISERITGIFIQKLIDEGKKGLFLPVIYECDTKPTLKEAIAQTRANKEKRTENKQKGIKSLIYAYRPILIALVPEFIFRLYRNRK